MLGAPAALADGPGSLPALGTLLAGHQPPAQPGRFCLALLKTFVFPAAQK